MINIKTTDFGTELEIQGTANDVFLESFSVIHAVATFISKRFSEEFNGIPELKEFTQETFKSIIDGVFEGKYEEDATVLKYDPEELMKQFKESLENDDEEEE